MATINTAIELQDGFTNVFYQVISSVNLGLAAMEDLNRSMSAPVDMASIEAARDSINQATIAVQEMDEAMQKVEAPSIKTPDAQVNWQSDSFEVFTNSGVERFQQEVQSVNNMFNTLNKTQQQIAATAAQTDLFPANAVADMNNMQNRLQLIQQKIQTIENNPLNIGMDSANMKMEQLRGQFVQAVQEQENLNRAVENMDVQAANEAYLRLSQTVSGTERYIRDNVNEQGRFNREIEQGVQSANDLIDKVKGVAAAYLSIQGIIGLLSNVGVTDMSGAFERIDTMNQFERTVTIMTGSSDAANAALTKLNATVTGTAYGLDVASKATQGFLTRGMDLNTATEQVRIWADAVSFYGEGTNEQLESVVDAIGKMYSKGTVEADQLDRLFDSGIGAAEIYADAVGMSVSQVKEELSDGTISAMQFIDTVSRALDSGMSAGAAQDAGATWATTFANLQAAITRGWVSIIKNLDAELASRGLPNTMEMVVMFGQKIESVLNTISGAMGFVIDCAMGIYNVMSMVGSFVADNWSIIEPIIMGIVTALGLYYGAMLLYNTITGISTAITAAKSFAEQVHAASLAMEAGATFTATAAQYGFNAALLACPLTWIIILIIALVAVFYAAIAAVNHFAGTSISATGAIAGVFASWVAFVINRFIMIYNYIASLAEFFMNVWAHPVYSTKKLFVNLADLILDFCISATEGFDEVATNLANAFIEGANLAIEGINWIIDALNQIPGVDIGNVGEINKTASITSSLRDVKNDLHDWLGPEPADYYSATKLDYISIGDAWDAGYSFGEAAEDKISGLFGGLFDSNAGIGAGLGPDTASVMEDMGSNIDDIAGNTGEIKDSIDITEEDLKYLRDIAEQESINRFTTAEIIIEQTNHNTVSGKMDLDGIVSGLTDAANEAVDIIAEGVHV